MAHVAIIGAGIGGVPCAFELRKLLAKEHRVTLIGSSAYFEFTPSNPWMAVGWREREPMRVLLREPLESKGIQWVPEPVATVDAPANKLTLGNGEELSYDYLVIATGPTPVRASIVGMVEAMGEENRGQWLARAQELGRCSRWMGSKKRRRQAIAAPAGRRSR